MPIQPQLEDPNFQAGFIGILKRNNNLTQHFVTQRILHVTAHSFEHDIILGYSYKTVASYEAGQRGEATLINFYQYLNEYVPVESKSLV